ncbi:uncharacterized protein LOC117174748 [Belonocnema kinseyi]|uniref:uncharacterized protein LOC117174748 n=1 Tax=Belonocnema kinseyi TaxID=2817044 RepID=UPI00143D9D97|nr:uncharacterized protein LOC117174748 [Belonocnema kinseyi]
MIVCNRNNFLRITIVLIIVTFSEELSVRRIPRVKREIDQTKINGDDEPAPREHEYFHKNDIGHLNDYYQERMKLREQYNAIQKSIQEKTFQNTTNHKDDPKKSSVDNNGPMQKRISPNLNSYDTFHSLKPGLEDINIASPGLGPNGNATKTNFNSTVEIDNSELGSQNKTYVKLGNCEGVVIYQQNIDIIGANYDAINGYSVDVNFEGICITCIEIISKNEEEVKVKITSGGPGKGETSLKFEGIDKNMNLSYQLKVWGVGRDC